MKRIKRKSIMLLVVLLISLLTSSVNVFAADDNVVEVTTKDTADNTFVTEMSVAGEHYGRDVYWFGNEMNMQNTEISGDLISAGYNIYADSMEVGGSVRSASYDLKLNNVHVDNNITATGNSLSFDENTTAKGVYACGNEIFFKGTCDALYITGNLVKFNGSVNGDVTIDGNNVSIGSDAVVTGTLTVRSSHMPTVPDTAEINVFEYEESEVPEPEAENILSPFKDFATKVVNRIYWIPAMILVALFFCLVMPKAVDGAGKMLLARPVVMPVTGFVTILSLLFALIILCVTWIGLPLAGLITLLVLPMFIFAVPFAGASVGRIILPKMNVWVSSIIGTTVLTMVIIIPIFGGLIKFLCMIYVFGYFVQKCYEQMKTLGKKTVAENVQESSIVDTTSDK